MSQNLWVILIMQIRWLVSWIMAWFWQKVKFLVSVLVTVNFYLNFFWDSKFSNLHSPLKFSNLQNPLHIVDFTSQHSTNCIFNPIHRTLLTYTFFKSLFVFPQSRPNQLSYARPTTNEIEIILRLRHSRWLPQQISLDSLMHAV